MKSLIIGAGEIGKSLLGVLTQEYDLWMIDKDQSVDEDFHIIHICFPYSDKFIGYVKEYQEKYKPKYTIIHSTVPPEVYDQLEAISSPCLGIHPHLEKSMKIFVKFLAGKGASDIADYFRRAGMKVYVLDNPKSTALMKILDTTYYAMCIEYTKDVKRQCDKLGVPFELWTLWTDNYNKGYQKLGYEEYTRPNLTAIMKEQGGHCTIPNLKLLDTPFTKFIHKLND
jgi:hypothetical protein